MLGSLLARPSNAINVETTTWGSWPGDNLNPSIPKVDRQTALQLMAVYGSVRMIVDGISTLPVDVFDTVNGDTIEAPKPRWLSAPYDNVDYETWCSQILTSLLLDGNAYLAVLRDNRSQIRAVQPLPPGKVEVRRDSGRLEYWLNGTRIQAELVHIRGLTLAGEDKGLSPVEYARRTIGLGIHALDYGSAFFDGDGRMPGVIEAPHPMQPDTMRNLAEQWRKKRRTGGQGLPGVLQNGAQWKPTGINHEQAQFLSTRQFTAAEIAGQMFLVDPTDLGIGVDGSSITYANLQQRNTRRVQVTFLPWIVRLEHALSTLVEPGFVKLNVGGLLRADPKARYEQYALGIDKGFITRNEARELEDLPPLPDGADAATPGEIAALIQKIYLGVGVVLSAEEAREIANRAGADLTGPFQQTAEPPRRNRTTNDEQS